VYWRSTHLLEAGTDVCRIKQLLGHTHIQSTTFYLHLLNFDSKLICQAAERYLKGTLNGRDKIPLPAWKTEREKLIAEKNQLFREHQKLKADTAAVEKIRSNIYDVVSVERRRAEPQRAQGLEL
jgi:hypothetical protein